MASKGSNAVHALQEEVRQTTKFTHKSINRMMSRVYALKEVNLENDTRFKILTHIEDVLKYENEKLNHFKSTVMTLVNTVFLPLGVLTGFFGMNFASMGNPDIKKGILSVKNSETFVFGLMFFFFIVTLLMFEFLFGVGI